MSNLNLNLLSERQTQLLSELIDLSTKDELIWISGLLNGFTQKSNGDATTIQSVKQPITASPSEPVTILFGTKTGNSKTLAEKAAEQIKGTGVPVNLFSMDEYKPTNIKKEKNLLVVTSTDGDGVPPLNAEDFCEFIQSKKAPTLTGLNYSVLALGDKSYLHFCKTGKDIDERFAELGAKRIIDRVDCDVDFVEPANEWLKKVFAKIKAESICEDVTLDEVEDLQIKKNDRKNPFYAEVLEKTLLNGRGS